MPKFKKNPNPIMKKGPYKMKYKHSAFPFKESPTKQTGTIPGYRGETADVSTQWRRLIEDRLDALDQGGTYQYDQHTQRHMSSTEDPLPGTGSTLPGSARRV